jgi:hypothetical protein
MRITLQPGQFAIHDAGVWHTGRRLDDGPDRIRSRAQKRGPGERGEQVRKVVVAVAIRNGVTGSDGRRPQHPLCQAA